MWFLGRISLLLYQISFEISMIHRKTWPVLWSIVSNGSSKLFLSAHERGRSYWSCNPRNGFQMVESDTAFQNQIHMWKLLALSSIGELFVCSVSWIWDLHNRIVRFKYYIPKKLNMEDQQYENKIHALQLLTRHACPSIIIASALIRTPESSGLSTAALMVSTWKSTRLDEAGGDLF